MGTLISNRGNPVVYGTNAAKRRRRAEKRAQRERDVAVAREFGIRASELACERRRLHAADPSNVGMDTGLYAALALAKRLARGGAP